MFITLLTFLCITTASIKEANSLSLEYSHLASSENGEYPRPEEVTSLFLSWLKRHRRPYDSDVSSHSFEKLHRFAIFADNFRHVFEHNKRAEEHGYWLDINGFADLTHDEFKATYLWKPAHRVSASQLHRAGRRKD